MAATRGPDEEHGALCEQASACLQQESNGTIFIDEAKFHDFRPNLKPFRAQIGWRNLHRPYIEALRLTFAHRTIFT
jgi:hypothetical protein